MLPFSHEQFLAVFAAYNEAVWPAPIAAYLAAALACMCVASRKAAAAHVAIGVTAALWLFTGIGYHWLFFRPINAAAGAFAAAFVVQAVLLAVAGMRGSVRFGTRPHRARESAGWALVAYATVLYPAIGSWFGVQFPAAPAFGITPCPLVIFTFGVLLLATRFPWWLLPIPVLWSFVGGSAAVQLGIPQDYALPASALVAVGFAWHAREFRHSRMPT